jgi:glycine cleavage system aminomethyltransferase T
VRRLVIDGRANAGDAVMAGDDVIGAVTSAAWSDERAVTVALAPLPRTAEGVVRVGAATATIAA